MLPLNDKQERSFAAHIVDLFDRAHQAYTTCFTGFLDVRQSAIARQVARESGHGGYLFFGGHPDGERLMLGVFAAYEEPDEGAFPIFPLTLSFRKEDEIGHRDILGSLTGLEIKREAVGDILVGDGVGVCFATEPAARVILSELNKVGRCGVRVSSGLPETLPALHKYADLPLNVSSLRLDCIVAAATGASREKAAQTIRGQLVAVNGANADEGARTLCEGDVVSIRGFGKFLFAQVEATTKKGRLRILCRKYV